MASQGSCSVCAAPPQVRDTIENELRKPLAERMKLRDLEKIVGISKSAISRHTQRHMPKAILADYKSATYDPVRCRLFIRWPDGADVLVRDVAPVPSWQKPVVKPNQIDDFVIVVQFEKPVAPRLIEPKPEMPNEVLDSPAKS